MVKFSEKKFGKLINQENIDMIRELVTRFEWLKEQNKKSVCIAKTYRKLKEVFLLVSESEKYIIISGLNNQLREKSKLMEGK